MDFDGQGFGQSRPIPVGATKLLLLVFCARGLRNCHEPRSIELHLCARIAADAYRS